MTTGHDFVYLASQSPRRRQLLEQIGVRYELLLPGADEDAEALEAERAGELPLAYVERVTQAKLRAARDRLVGRGLAPAPILCSDTTVALGRRIFGKPADDAEARRMLGALSGHAHRVITAVAVASEAGDALAISSSKVRFATLGEAQIDRYIESREPFGKAGAYAVQGVAATWIEHLEGSYSGIMGLPLYETARLLRQARVRF
jgi:septum formation protein